jgi:hypothetical protein
MTVKRMDNVGIVVESLDAAIPFFEELGLSRGPEGLLIGLAEEFDLPRKDGQ